MPVLTPSHAALSTWAHRYLLASGVLPPLVTQGLLGADPTYPLGWVFRPDVDGVPFRAVENTGKGALCLFSSGSWAAPSVNHTAKFPTLQLAVFMDPTRDASGMPSHHDAAEKALRLWEAVHPLFHDPANRIHRFGDLPVISTVAGGGFTVADIPSGDGAVRGDISYQIVL